MKKIVALLSLVGVFSTQAFAAQSYYICKANDNSGKQYEALLSTQPGSDSDFGDGNVSIRKLPNDGHGQWASATLRGIVKIKSTNGTLTMTGPGTPNLISASLMDGRFSFQLASAAFGSEKYLYEGIVYNCQIAQQPESDNDLEN